MYTAESSRCEKNESHKIDQNIYGEFVEPPQAEQGSNNYITPLL
jgi:uncharacterized metal-binding protein YceD (DUF177 family)